MELACFDPLKMKTPLGAISKKTKVSFFVEANVKCLPNELYLMIREDSESEYKYILMQKSNERISIKNSGCFENGKSDFAITENAEIEKVRFFADVEFEKEGLYFYNFKLNYNDFSKFLSKTNDNFSVVLDEKGEDFVQVVTVKNYESENSIQGGLIYQIYVDRFCKLGEHNLPAPLQKRDDWGGKIKKNTSDPVKINEEIFGGTLDGVASKFEFLKELGVTVIYLNPICEAFSNHKYDTADFMKVDESFGGDLAFENLAKKAKALGIKIIIDGVYNHTGSDSLYFNKKSRYKTLGAFNSKSSKFFDWYSFENYPEKYDCWWGIVTLPSVKKDCLDFQNFIAGDGGVIEKFMKMGASGVRLDVVDELSDEFTKRISEKVLSFDKNAVVMGEVWEDASTKISYSKRRKYFVDCELNSVMNYPLKEALVRFLKFKETSDLVSTLRMLKNNYPKIVLDNLMNTLGTHDTGRIFSELLKVSGGDRAVATSLLKIGFVILFTLPGVPSIFYGDEYGMENNDDSSRGCYDWQNYDNEIFKFTKSLAKIRSMNVLKNGDFKILMAESGKFVFERKNEFEQIVVLSNLRKEPLFVTTDENFISFFSQKKIKNLTLPENSFEILICNIK